MIPIEVSEDVTNVLFGGLAYHPTITATTMKKLHRQPPMELTLLGNLVDRVAGGSNVFYYAMLALNITPSNLVIKSKGIMADKDASSTGWNPFNQIVGGQGTNTTGQWQGQPQPGQPGFDPNMNQFLANNANKFWQGGNPTGPTGPTGPTNTTGGQWGNPTNPTGQWGNPTNTTGGQWGNPTNPAGGQWGNPTNPTNPTGGQWGNPTNPTGGQWGNPTVPTGPKCTSNHPLVLTANLPAKYTGNRFSCDQCKKTESASPNQVWHCDICSYDVCRACAKQ